MEKKKSHFYIKWKIHARNELKHDGPCELALHYYFYNDFAAVEQMARTAVSSGGDMNRTIRWQDPSCCLSAAGSSSAQLTRTHTCTPYLSIASVRRKCYSIDLISERNYESSLSCVVIECVVYPFQV